jgi:hypothetical protein
MPFGPPTTDTPGTGDDICGRFMVLSYRDHMFTESQQIHLFTTDLGKPLRTDVTLRQQTSLDVAVMFMRAYE